MVRRRLHMPPGRQGGRWKIMENRNSVQNLVKRPDKNPLVGVFNQHLEKNMNSDLTTLPEDGSKYPSFNLPASNVQHQEWKHYMPSSSKSLESPENSTNILSSLNAVLIFQYIYYTTYIVYLEDRTEPIYTSHKYIHAYIYIYIVWKLLDNLNGNCWTVTIYQMLESEPFLTGLHPKGTS